MIKTEIIVHRDQQRVKLDFAYDSSISNKIKQIEGAAWSKTHRAWHIPCNQKSIDQLKVHFPDLVLPELFKKEESIPPEPVSPVKANETVVKNNRNSITIEVIGRKILLKLPKNESDIKFINTLKYSRWDGRMFCWEIPNYPGNLDLIKDYFNDRIDGMVIHESYDINVNSETRTIGNKGLIIIKTRTGRLKLIFGFDNALRLLIKSYPYHSWDAQNKWWTIPFSEKYVNEIQLLAHERGLNFSYEEELPGSAGIKRMTAFDIPNYRECPQEMILKLKEIRYSDNTIKIYKSSFEEFINYYHKFDINKIDETQIISFLRYLVIERKVSTSYQNQVINAIKFYYEKVLGGQRKFYFIDRPKKERALPTVLNDQEVISLFKHVENIKHKCILMLAYSAGLRLGEIVRLKLVDFDRERMQIRVVQSKGKKDRYAKLSTRFLAVLDAYTAKYRPKEYVFEGAKGEDYSPSSIQNIIKAVSQKAGIQKRTTMHTLRHTFATHSLENGVDLRYIQSMMGHENSKTTEIYTHITTKGFDQIKSPLDNLDF
jgi:site-specific recombinase XerD